MKSFFGSLLGTLTGLFLFFGGLFLCGIIFLMAMAAIGRRNVAPGPESGSYLVFDLSGNIQDAPAEFDSNAFLGPLMGGERQQTFQLRQVTRTLRAAARDSRIAGLFVTGNLRPGNYGSGFGALKEVRAAILAFGASGKPVIAYLKEVNTRDYFVASAARDVVIDPYGMIVLPGLASQPLFMAGAFEKFGVGVQVTRVGKYKSAIEPYTRKDLSPEAREDLQKLLDDLWADLLRDVGASRHLRTADIQRLVDTEGLIPAKRAVACKLADRLAYRDEIIDELKVKTGRVKGTKESFKQIDLAAYMRSLPATPSGSWKNGIAVVYAEGDIVDGEGQSGEVGGVRFARELRRIRQDDSIKAVVLRVNSPGGSATASEEIQRELRLTMAKKPVIVSMGTLAASGGYWISTYSHRIFAEPTTITGSIGVYGMAFNIQQLANGLGFTWDTVKTGKMGDVFTISRPKTEAELAVIQKQVDWIYDEFVGKVADARKLGRAKVQEIAQGRVWSGAEAKKLGLVDEIGGLGNAIAYAAAQARLGSDYRLVEYPRKRALGEIIGEMMKGISPEQADDDSARVKRLLAPFQAELKILLRHNDPQGLYARMPVTVEVQ